MVGRREAKEWAKAHLKGLFSSPSAPFTPDFALDEAGIVRNVERVIAAGASGVGVGYLDAWGLTIAQRKHAMDLIAAAIILWVPYEWASSQGLMHDYVDYVAGKVEMFPGGIMPPIPRNWQPSRRRLATGSGHI